MKTINSVRDAMDLVGNELGVSSWWEIDQARISGFANVTDDHQWIHVDVARADVESPYGATIAHGFLTLSLLPAMSKEIYVVRGARMGLNYGLNKVRFLAPVVCGARIRLRSAVAEAAQVTDDTVNWTLRHTVEIDGAARPAAVAELITRWIF